MNRRSRIASTVWASVGGTLAACLLACCAAPAATVDFAGGMGELYDPYQIATAEQLLAIGSDPDLQEKHFILVADIDLDPNLLGDEVPMSGLVLSTGSLNGNGHGIVNLELSSGRIRRGDGPSSRGFSALFGSIGPNAIVRDLSLEGIHTSMDSAPSRAAMLAIKNEGTLLNCQANGQLFTYTGGGLVVENLGYILNCSVSGSASGLAVGGLAGTNAGTIMYSSSAANVAGGSGLAVENSGTVVASFATGDVTEGTAGLVGDNYGRIRYCYATGDVYTENDQAGGLVGTNWGEISDCYATGNVRAEEDAAGLVGYNEGTITHCYATGVAGMPLVANGYGDGTVLGCYAPSVPDGGETGYGFAILLTDGQMRRQESFVGWDFAGTQRDGTLDTWTMPEDGGYPVPTVLRMPEQTGTGTIDDPYFVRGYPDLIAISGDPTACYQLTADIDLGGLSFLSALVPVFQGHFDGAGHCISNFVLTGEWNLGVFGVLHSEATVVDLNIHGARMVLTSEDLYPESMGLGTLAALSRGTVSGCTTSTEITVKSGTSSRDIGGLIGINEGGEIRNCSARFAMTHPAPDFGPASYHVGGLVGYNGGTIIECHASSYTNGQFFALGGLVGGNDGRIADCYADGYITGDRKTRPQPSDASVGGLIGENAGSVENCYAATVVAFNPAGGGLVGGSSEGEVSTSYFLAEADGGGPDNGYGTALSAEEMRREASFGGWDFEDIWMICEGVDSPRLRWENVVCEP